MAKRKIFSLFGSIVIEGMAKTKAELSEVDKSIRKMNAKLNKLGRDMVKTGKAMSAGITAPVIAVGSALLAASNKAGQYADKMLDLQQITGLSTDNLQGLEAIAGNAGVSFEGLSQTIASFTGRLPTIAAGTGASAEAIKRLGVNIYDSSGNVRDMNDLFPEMINALQGMDDVTERNAIAQQVFGKSLNDLAPVLGMSSEQFNEMFHGAENLAGYMSNDALNSANSYRVRMDELRLSFEGIYKSLATAVIPVFSDTLIPVIRDTAIPMFYSLVEGVKSVIEWFKEHKVIASFAGTFAAVLTIAGPLLILFSKFIPLIKSAVALYKVLTASQVTLNAAMAANPVGLIVVAIAGLIAAGVALYKNWDVVKAKFFDVWDGIKYHFMNIASQIAIVHSNMILTILKGINQVGQYVPGLNKGLDLLISTTERGIYALEKGIEARTADNRAKKSSIALAKSEANAVEKAKQSVQGKTEAVKEHTGAVVTATAEEIAAAEKLKQKRIDFESEWSERLAESRRGNIESLIHERDEALRVADELGADKQKIIEYYDDQMVAENAHSAKEIADAERALNRDLEESRLALLDDQIEILDRETALKHEALEEQRLNAVAEAERIGLDVEKVNTTFQNRSIAIEKSAAEKRKKIQEEALAKIAKSISSVSGVVNTVVSAINNVWQQSLKKREAEIDAETEKRIEAVQNSTMTEQQKADAITAINEEADAKKLELQRENAKREKAATIMGIILNTAMGIAAALTIPVAGIALAAVVGALGAVQLGIAAATPIPFEKGGLVQADPGRGVFAQIGEGKQDELVLPMKTGAQQLASDIVGLIKGSGGIGSSGVASMPQVVNEFHYHVGTLIADNFGIKEFAKRVNKHIIAEGQRTGAIGATA